MEPTLPLLASTTILLELSGVVLASLGALYLGVLCVGELRRLHHAREHERHAQELFAWKLRARLVQYEREQARAENSWVGYRKFAVARVLPANAAGDIKTFVLTPHDGKRLPPFKPGQFLMFKVLPPGEKRPLVRCYSLSSHDHRVGYQVSIKRLPGGRGSGYFHEHVSEGTILDVQAPGGDFWLDTTETTPVVLVAGGIGVTPVLSMLEAIAEHQPLREAWFLYGVRHGEELVRADEISRIASLAEGVRVVFCYSSPNEADQELIRQSSNAPGASVLHVRGRIAVRPPAEAGSKCFDITSLLPEGSVRSHHFYMCGPLPMLDSMKSDLSRWGVAADHIHMEEFAPPTQAPVAGAAPVEVKFERTSKTLVWAPADGSLLDFGLANEIEMSYGCKTGNCGECKTAVLSGKFSYAKPPSFHAEAGCCLPCVATPDGPITLDA